MGTPALYKPDGVVVDVIQDGEELAYVKFPGGKVLWVKSAALDFDDLGGDDDWGPEYAGDDRWNSDLDADCALMVWDEDWDDSYSSGDYYDFEFDR